MATTLISDERIPMGYTTIKDALTRTETPEEKKMAREERRTNMIAVRRRKAADALAVVPGYACEVADLLASDASDEDQVLAVIQGASVTLRAQRDTDEHEVAARLALEALGALWAVL